MKEQARMQDLTLVGLTEDKSRLLLVSDAGDEYSLRADATLLAALRGDHARLGQLEIQMDSTLRPRDIQARIRAGETPENVAAAAQTTVDRIMGFATPVLAERAHMAERAQRSSVRRKAGEGNARVLWDAVAQRLRERNIDPESVAWDAWRREDGRWSVVADYRSGDSARHAEFLFDVPGRYVVAEDEEARWLVGEQSARRGPQPRSGGTQRRLASVRLEDELPLGADAIDLVTDDDAESTDEERTADLTEPAAAVRHRHPGLADPSVGAGDADWMATQASDRPAPAEPVAMDTESGRPGEPDVETSTEEDVTDRPARKQARKSRGRASVPSWDEIMFGGGRHD